MNLIRILRNLEQRAARFAHRLATRNVDFSAMNAEELAEFGRNLERAGGGLDREEDWERYCAACDKAGIARAYIRPMPDLPPKVG